MSAREIDSKEESLSLIGMEIAVSEWLELTQIRINSFADATEDHQWIHTDKIRASKESPYGTTIAHGFLTLSMLYYLMMQSVKIRFPIKMMVNYGLNKVRFPSAVPSGTKIRVRIKLQSVQKLSDGFQIEWNMTVERDGVEKPCCVAEWLIRYYE